MSLNDITRYVRQTPGNTNPSVVASMVNAEMNSTLEEAKKYTDSQRLGYIENTRLICDWFSGAHGESIKIFGLLPCIKVSTNPAELSKDNVKRISCYADGDYGQINGDLDLNQLFVDDQGQSNFGRMNPLRITR